MTNTIQTFIHATLTTISNISSRFSGNSEAFASELLENLEDSSLKMHMDILCNTRVNYVEI